MRRSPLNYRTALACSLGISLLTNVIFFVFFLFGRHALPIPEEGEAMMRHRDPNLFRISVQLIANFLFPFFLYLLNFRVMKRDMGEKKKLFLLIVSTVLIAGILSWLLSLIQIELFDGGRFPQRFIIGNLTRDYFTAAIVVISAQLIYTSYVKQRTDLLNRELQAENLRTRYEVLKNQLDPHFLFNSLNTLNSLIPLDAGRAQEYVLCLSAVFRYTLRNSKEVPLEEELRFTKDYCSLLEIRYGDSVAFEFCFDEACMDRQIIPFSLQVLVENAIKHNVISRKQPLVVTLRRTEQGEVEVSNPIRPKKRPESGEGIGLANLAERYRLRWGKSIRIEDNGGIFRVFIPLMP